jgi:hypothetical protein
VKDINIGDIFNTNNYGKFKIVSLYLTRKKRMKCYNVEFLLTGSIRENICRREILRGEVKDYYYPSIAGVGYLGEDIQQKDYKREYSVWKHMLHRCYNEKCDSYFKYGKLGVTVCDRWHCFKNFIEDITKIDGYNKTLFDKGLIQLDKDLKSNTFPKQYGVLSCTFISTEDNVAIFKFQRKYAIRKFDIGHICIKSRKEKDLYESKSRFCN